MAITLLLDSRLSFFFIIILDKFLFFCLIFNARKTTKDNLVRKSPYKKKKKFKNSVDYISVENIFLQQL